MPSKRRTVTSSFFGALCTHSTSVGSRRPRANGRPVAAAPGYQRSQVSVGCGLIISREGSRWIGSADGPEQLLFGGFLAARHPVAELLELIRVEDLAGL